MKKRNRRSNRKKKEKQLQQVEQKEIIVTLFQYLLMDHTKNRYITKKFVLFYTKKTTVDLTEKYHFITYQMSTTDDE